MFDQSLDMAPPAGASSNRWAEPPPRARCTSCGTTRALIDGRPSQIVASLRRPGHATQRKESTMTPTRTRKRLIAATSVATAAALGLAACSGGGAPATSSTGGGGGGGGNS